MSKTKKRESKSEIGLKHIDRAFSAYGTFITGLFCIADYFWGEIILYKRVAVCVAIAILFVTYYLSFGKYGNSKVVFWTFVERCAKAAGMINPIMLATSILVCVEPSIKYVFVCTLLEIAQIAAFIVAWEKVKPNKNSFRECFLKT